MMWGSLGGLWKGYLTRNLKLGKILFRYPSEILNIQLGMKSPVVCPDFLHKQKIFLDHRFTIPNFPSRLLGYMQAKLPVLACTDKNTDIGKVVVEGGFGWWCESNDVGEFGRVVERVLKKKRKYYVLTITHYGNTPPASSSLLETHYFEEKPPHQSFVPSSI